MGPSIISRVTANNITCVPTPNSDSSATVTTESSPSLFSPVTEEKLACNFGSLPTASQLLQNLSATHFGTPSGSTTPTTILENMHEATAENESRRTETTTDNFDTPKVILTSRKRRSKKSGPVKNSLIRNSERKLKLSI